MKRLISITLIFLSFFCFSQAQTTTSKADLYQKTFYVAPRLGYDFPSIKNSNPYVDYKGGLEFGLSADYYWKHWGLGVDFDYINNTAENTFPTTNLYQWWNGAPFSNFILSEDKIKRTFLGIGPDYRWKSKNDKMLVELNTRVGIGSVKGGRVNLLANGGGFNLSYQAGYNFKLKPAAKVQTKTTYFFSEKWGAHAGVYYLRHFGVNDYTEPGYISPTVYQDISSGFGSSSATSPTPAIVTSCGSSVTRRGHGCSVASVGVFAGVTYRLRTKDEKKDDKYSLVVTAKDKYTNQVIPYADVVVKNTAGNIIATAATNSFGVVIFDPIQPENYIIEGRLSNIDLAPSSALATEFVKGEPLQKEVLYTMLEFIVKGTVVECSSANGIERVKVTTEDKSNNAETSVYTNNNGQYALSLEGNKEYKIYGKKDMYMSQIETISTRGLNRSTTLFVKLEICMNEVNCDEALALKNLHYDVDQFTIRNDAKPQLDEVVQFMIDNPTVRLELSSHTDSRATSEYNQDLSQKRANAAVDYVVTQGISKSRITGIGFGESRLLNKCSDGVNCSEAKHQVNRRTEMKVSCK